MHRFPTIPIALTALALAALSTPTPVVAQSDSTPRGLKLPPIRQLGAVTATAAEPLGGIATLRPLADGRVMVNDPAGRRVILFDAALQHFTVVADSLGANGNTYSGRLAGLIPFHGDSTLFVDPQSLSMLVLDASGKVGRVMSVPSTQDAMSFAGVLGAAAFDTEGRLVYRASPRFEFRNMGGAPGGPPRIPEMPDSAPIFRIDLATRKIDTLGYVKTPKIRMNVTQADNGRMMMTSEVNPLPVVDEWAVVSDGSVAFVRGRDYHIDWVNADGSRSASPKIPFEWQRLTDEDKVAFIDSVKAARERMGENAPMVATPGGGSSGGSSANSASPGGPPPDGGPRIMIFGGPPGGDGPPRRGNGVQGNMQFAAPQLNFVPPSELPDYKPPFLTGFVRSDLDGNVWIRTIPTRAIAGGPVYDVVNRQGELIDRVQIPVNRTIAAFGPNGVVYLTTREGTVTKLEKATLR